MKKTSILIVGIIAAVAGVGVIYDMKSTNQSVARSGPPLATVKVPDLSDKEKDGEFAFNTYCAACHGKDAAGQDGVAPSFVHPIYEPGHHGDEAFFLAARKGVRAHHWQFGDMPPVEGVSEPELAGIVSYVRALQRANGVE